MADKRTRRRFAHLKKLPTEELEAILRMDYELGFESSEAEAMVDYVLELIVARENKRPTGRFGDDDEAWRKFCLKYMPPQTGSRIIFPASPSALAAQEQAAKAKKRKRILTRWISAAAAVVLVLTILVPPVLGHENVFTVVGRWTDEIFSFARRDPVPQTDPPTLSTSPFRSENKDLEKVYTTLTAQGVYTPVVPTWLPEGYELDNIDVQNTPRGTIINSKFANETSTISFTVSILNNFTDTGTEYEKNPGEAVIYDVEGIAHYLMDNKEQPCCVWVNENLECMLRGTITQNDLYTIINSIYQGE